MKYKVKIWIWLGVLFLTGTNFVFGEPRESHFVTYVESNNGLETPELDGGRIDVEMADINADGNLDLLSVGDHGSPYVNTNQHGIMVWFGDGAGNWNVHQSGEFGYGGIAIGDVNGDGHWDVAYGMHHNWSATDLGDQVLEVALGDGTGLNWTAWDDNLGMDGQTWGMFATDFADLDNDGDLDMGSVAFGCFDGLHVYENNFNGSWTRVFGFLGGNSGMIYVFGDVNCDGLADFAVSHQNGTVYLGDGVGNFTVADGNLPAGGSYGRRGVSLADVNGDGCDDLSFSNSDDGLEVWVWSGSNTWTDFSGTLPSSGQYAATQLTDLDMDGLMDIAAFGYSLCTVWTGDGNGNWTQVAQFNTPTPGYFKAFHTGLDADHNGYPDIVIVSEEGSIFDYQNHLHFYKEASTPTTLNVYPVAPSLNKTYYAGSVQFIKWTSSVPAGYTSDTITLALSVSGSGGPWQTLDTSIPNGGIYQWHLSSSLPTTNSAYIRYTVDTDQGSVSSLSYGSFNIIGAAAPQNPSEAGLPLLCQKGPGTSIDCVHTNGGPCTTDNTIYYGNLSGVSGYTYSASECFLGTGGTASIDPGEGNWFWVIVSNNDTYEGSYGKNSSDVERPEVTGIGSCDYSQELTDTC